MHIISFPKEKAFLISKTKIDEMTNDETVDQITDENAKRLNDTFSVRIIKKTRHIVYLNKKKWENDVFEQPIEGLILAEIELEDKFEDIYLPPWIIKEVTGDPEYY